MAADMACYFFDPLVVSLAQIAPKLNNIKFHSISAHLLELLFQPNNKRHKAHIINITNIYTKSHHMFFMIYAQEKLIQHEDVFHHESE